MVFRILAMLIEAIWGQRSDLSVLRGPTIFHLTFDDGTELELLSEDLIEEYLRLRILYHAWNDRLDLIPYTDAGFKYEVGKIG